MLIYILIAFLVILWFRDESIEDIKRKTDINQDRLFYIIVIGSVILTLVVILFMLTVSISRNQDQGRKNTENIMTELLASEQNFIRRSLNSEPL